jgi:hypothetical protein
VKFEFQINGEYFKKYNYLKNGSSLTKICFFEIHILTGYPVFLCVNGEFLS